MPDLSPAAGAGTTNPGAASPAQASEGSEPAKHGNSEELQALRKELGWACLQIRKLTAAKSEPTTTDPGESPTVREDLQKLRNEIKAERDEAQRERREAALQQAVVTAGIDSDTAELLIDHVTVRHGNNIKVDGKTVFHEDPTTGERTPVKDFVAELLKGPKGDRFRAPVKTESSKNLRSSSTQASNRPAFHELPQAEQDKLYSEGKAHAYVREDIASGR